MISEPLPADAIADRVKLPFTFDVSKMITEVEAFGLGQFEYYDVKPLRSPAHMVDPTRPLPPPAEDYADGSWTDWLNTPEFESSPYLKSIVETFAAHTRITLVRVLRLASGDVVKEHNDPTLGLHILRSVIRLTVPIIVDEGVAFYLNGEVVPMKPGECWYMRLSDTHKVVNESLTDRISLTVDMEPNEWVRAMISEAQATME